MGESGRDGFIVITADFLANTNEYGGGEFSGERGEKEEAAYGERAFSWPSLFAAQVFCLWRASRNVPPPQARRLLLQVLARRRVLDGGGRF